MRPRIELLENALTDYEDGRYYSTVLVLLSVMDGFVNDVDKAKRRGLHSRTSEEMTAWDSVVGHHMGLTHAHKSFTRPFRKTDTSRVTELHRHGIVHGNLVDFDNDVVATKAWNRLFAVADWADARQRQAEPPDPPPSLRELWKQVQAVANRNKKLDQWQAHDYGPADAGAADPELLSTVESFLKRWQKRQWSLVGEHLTRGALDTSTGKMAVQAKEVFQDFHLSKWAVIRVHRGAAALAHVEVELTVDGTQYRTDLRWLRMDERGQVAPDWEAGTWFLAPYGPSSYLKPENVVAPAQGEDGWS